MADYLISRFLVNAPNVHNGAWADIEIVRDLPASATQDDILAAMSNTADLEGKVRISRWDNVEEYDTVPSAPTLAKAVKEAKA